MKNRYAIMKNNYAVMISNYAISKNNNADSILIDCSASLISSTIRTFSVRLPRFRFCDAIRERVALKGRSTSA